MVCGRLWLLLLPMSEKTMIICMCETQIFLKPTSSSAAPCEQIYILHVNFTYALCFWTSEILNSISLTGCTREFVVIKVVGLDQFLFCYIAFRTLFVLTGRNTFCIFADQADDSKFKKADIWFSRDLKLYINSSFFLLIRLNNAPVIHPF